MKKIIFCVIISIGVLCISIPSTAQLNKKTIRDFENLSTYSENGDYKAGLFYTKKTEKFIIKKTGTSSPEYVLFLCYKAFFLNQLDYSKEYTETTLQIESLLETIKQTNNTSALLEVYKMYSKLYFSNGIYVKSDKIYSILKTNADSLLPIERNELAYYKAYADFKKGYLNEVTALAFSKIKPLLEKEPMDSVYKRGKLSYQNLTKSQVLDRNVLSYNFFILQLKAMLENGLGDSVLSTIEKNEKLYSNLLSSKKSALSELYFIKGQTYLIQNEFRKAEHELHKASTLAKDFYLSNSKYSTDIQHSLITAQLAQNKNEEAEYYNNDVSVQVIGYFGKNSLAYLHNNYTDIELLLINHQWEEAQKELTTFINSPLLQEVHEYRSVALSDLYYTLVKKHQYIAADTVLKKLYALQLFLYGEDSPVLTKTKLKQATLYSNYLDRFSESKALFKDIINDNYLTHISVSNPEYVNALTSESKLFEYLEDYKQASEVLYQGLSKTEAAFGNQSVQYAKLLNPTAALNITMGNYEKASSEIDKSISILTNRSSKSTIQNLAQALEIKARLKIIEGNYKQADSLLKEATLAYSKISRLSTDDLFSIEEIGLLYIHTGKYNKADKFLRKILLERESAYGIDHKSTYTILNYLGELNVVTGNYGDADRYFERSTAITKKVFGEKSIPYANSLVYQKKLYAVLGDAEKSTKVLKEAIEIYSKAYGQENIKVGILLHELALSSIESIVQKGGNVKDKKELEKLLTTSFSIIKKNLTEESPAYANALEDAALYSVYVNDPKRALTYLEQAKLIWSKKLSSQNNNSARLEMLAGKIYYKMQEYTKALEAFEKSKNMYASIFDESHPTYIEALGKCAQLYYILNQRAKAVESIEYCIGKSRNYLKTVFPLLSEKGKSSYWEKIKDDFEFYKTLTFNSPKVDDEMVAKVLDIQIQTRAILLNSQIKVKQKILGSGDTLLIRLYQDMLTNRENLALAYSMTTSERKDAGLDIGLLETNNDRLEKELSEKTELFSNTDGKIEVLDWKALKKVMNPDELLLEITPFRLFTNKFSDTIWYAIISIDPSTSKPSYALLQNGKELQTKYLKYYRNIIKFNTQDEYSYEVFWKPLLPLIKPTHKNIYLVRDGVYNQINPETFKDTQGNYLINSTRIHNLVTSRDLFYRASPKKKKNEKESPEIDFFGNPIYYSSDFTGLNTVHQLPGSEIEVKKIDSLLLTKHWNTLVYLNNEATEEKIKQVNSPRVLHISTHGFFIEEKKRVGEELREVAADNPLLRSGLVMKDGGNMLAYTDFNLINKKDGILTAYEVLNLSLDKTDLVVLSACETGLGEVKLGEGVLGLQRSFQVAGAQTVIMSIFKVSDEVTQKLMLAFYNNWLRTGNKFDSFTLAKKEILSQYNEPILWGAFVMVGGD